MDKVNFMRQCLATFIIFLLCAIFTITFAQCPTNAVMLTTQSDVDNFTLNYPGCSILNESLFIEGNGINNLNGLAVLQEVEFINIQNTSITNLSGLNNLTKVSVSVKIDNNNSIVNLTGLENLEELNGIWLSNNPNLNSIISLSNVTTIVRDIFISSNPALLSLNGLQGSGVNGPGSSCESVVIIDNDLLTNLIGLPNVEQINQSLRISGNDGLINLNGLSNLKEIGSSFNVIENNMLKSFNGVNNLEYCQNLLIRDNLILPNLQGLDNLNTVLYRLTIEDHSALQNVSGIENLSSVANIWVRNNSTSLTSLTGLENLNSAEEIWIENNDGLVSMTGLDGLQTVDELFEIEMNDGLLNLSGLENLASVGTATNGIHRLEISQNASLQSLIGLTGLSNLSGYLSVILNPSLTSVTGLDNLVSASYIAINNNDALINVDPLSMLTTILNNLNINNNASLVSIMGLSSLNSPPSNFVSISNNPLLTLCHAAGICFLIENHSTTVNISNNAGTCFELTDVAIECGCTPVLYYNDYDGDGFGSNFNPVLICAGNPGPSGYVANNDDCNDFDPNDSNISVTYNVFDDLEANVSIESSGQVTAVPTEVTFQAGSYIILQPDFDVVLGADFQAIIDTCGN